MAKEFNVICKPDRGGEFLEASSDYIIPVEYRARDDSGEVYYLSEDCAVGLAEELQFHSRSATYFIREA